MLIFRHDKLEKHKYWTWEEYLQLPALSESEFLDKCNDVLEKATIRCFRNCTNASSGSFTNSIPDTGNAYVVTGEIFQDGVKGFVVTQ